MKRKINFKMVIITIINLFILSTVLSYALSSIRVIRGEQFVPTVFNYTGAIIESGSMSPYAEVGDYLIIKKIKAEKIKANDVITFESKGILVTHRIEDITNENGNIKFTTKGDSNNILDDEYLDGNNVVGKSIAVIPKVGSVIKFISSKVGLIIGVMVILLILSLSDKEKEKEKEKELKKI